jgi:hypothetical protein
MSGTTGFAEVEAFKGTDYDRACQLSFNIDGAETSRTTWQVVCTVLITSQLIGLSGGSKAALMNVSRAQLPVRH